MPKPLNAGEQKTVDQIAIEITRASNQPGNGIAVNQTSTFQAITKKGTKIRIARPFAKAVNSGELQGIRMTGRTKANHVLYSASASASGSAASAGIGFFQRLFGG